MQLHLYRGAEGGGGPPFGRKHISISQITTSVALVLGSLRLRLAFPARRASLSTDNQTSDSASHSKQWPPSFAGILPTNQNICNARPNARWRARYSCCSLHKMTWSWSPGVCTIAGQLPFFITAIKLSRKCLSQCHLTTQR